VECLKVKALSSSPSTTKKKKKRELRKSATTVIGELNSPLPVSNRKKKSTKLGKDIERPLL
jgi:hypothetical protein